MPKDTTPGKPTTRRYSDKGKADAVRIVRTLRAELGTEHGTVQRVASQFGYGTESVRLWVRQADIDDGHAPGVTSTEAARIAALEENRELRRAIEILKRAASFFGAEFDRQHKKSPRSSTPTPTPYQNTTSGTPAAIKSSTCRASDWARDTKAET